MFHRIGPRSSKGHSEIEISEKLDIEGFLVVLLLILGKYKQNMITVGPFKHYKQILNNTYNILLFNISNCFT